MVFRVYNISISGISDEEKLILKQDNEKYLQMQNDDAEDFFYDNYTLCKTTNPLTKQD